MMAVKSVAGAATLPSVKVATVPEKFNFPKTLRLTPWAVSAESATVKVTAIEVPPPGPGLAAVTREGAHSFSLPEFYPGFMAQLKTLVELLRAREAPK
jgi:hypothetical protein